MKTLTEKYNAVLEGKFSKSQFVKDAKRELPKLISPYNGYQDTIQILKSKGMIFEAVKDTYVSSAELEYSKIKGIDKFPIYDVERGIDYELEAAGFDSVSLDGVTLEEKEKACKKVVKNLEKDPLHYINLISGESSKVDKHDKMVPVKKGNEVDVHNGMKKATLKENKIDEVELPSAVLSKANVAVKDAKSMAGLLLQFIDQVDDKENPNIFKNAKLKRAVEFLKDLSDDEASAPAATNEKATSVNIASGPDDVIDPHDYVEIGQGYLKNFKRPHTLKDADLETLGRKIVKVLARGDIEKAKEKFISPDTKVDEMLDISQSNLSSRFQPSIKTVEKNKEQPEKLMQYIKSLSALVGRGDKDSIPELFVVLNHIANNNIKLTEQMSDDEMAAIKDYGKEEKPVKPYVLGDKFSTDFDYEGMLKAGLKVRLNTPLSNLEKLYDSFEDVNYHSENRLLADVIDKIEKKDKSGALDAIRNYKKELNKTLDSINEGTTPIREKVNEYRGAADDIDRIVKDKAMNSGFEEREEAAEVIEYLANKYKLNLKMIQNYMDSPDEPVNPFAEDDVDETKGAPKGHYFTKSGNLVKGRLTKAAREKGARLSDPKDKQRSKIPPVTQYNEELAPTGIGISQKQIDDLIKLGAIAGVKVYVRDKDGSNVRLIDYTLTNTDYEKNPDDIDFPDRYEDMNEEPNEGNKFEAERLKAIKAGKDHFEVDGKKFPLKGVGADDKKRAAMAKESIKAIITKVLEEGVITEAATQNLASFAETYGGFEGMKAAIIQLQDIVTDIESYYDKTRINIQKIYDTLGDIRNEEGLKVGGFLAPAIETAFNKDLRPVTKLGFTKGLDTPKVKVLSRDDMMRMKSGQDIEEKQTVYSPIRENKNKNKKK